MGSAKLQLSNFELNRSEDVSVKLEDSSRPTKDLGELKLNVTLWPKTQEDKEQASSLCLIISDSEGCNEDINVISNILKQTNASAACLTMR